MDEDLRRIEARIEQWRQDGVDAEIIKTLKNLVNAVRHWKHEYAIAHNDAVVNAHYASRLEKEMDS